MSEGPAKREAGAPGSPPLGPDAPPLAPPAASGVEKVPASPALPPALQSVLAALPSESWLQVRVVVVRTEEEGELVDMIPDLHRVMRQAPPRLVTRVRSGAVRSEDFDRGYARLHESLHGVREAIAQLLDLAGLAVPEEPKGKGATSRDPAPLGAPRVG